MIFLQQEIKLEVSFSTNYQENMFLFKLVLIRKEDCNTSHDSVISLDKVHLKGLSVRCSSPCRKAVFRSEFGPCRRDLTRYREPDEIRTVSQSIMDHMGVIDSLCDEYHYDYRTYGHSWG